VNIFSALLAIQNTLSIDASAVNHYDASTILSKLSTCGTYAVGNDQVSINLKLIELSEGRILSSTDYTLPTSDWYNF
jgi:hypothetical protein